MRTTVTLDSDTESALRRVMNERGLSFKRALNDAVRAGISGAEESPTNYTRAHSMGVPHVDFDKALRLAGQFEDEEIIRKMNTGK